MADVGAPAIGSAPGQGHDGAAEVAHGLRALAGVDGLALGGVDDVTELGGGGVGGFVEWDEREEKEPHFEDLELPLLPLMVLFCICEF